MRALFAAFLAIGLLGLSGIYFYKGDTLSACAFLAGACAVLIPSIMGRRGGDWESASAAIDFVRNPAGAIVDAAVDRIGDAIGDRKAERAGKEEPGFDADAAFNRYMARRTDASSAPLPVEAAMPAPRTFGRKGAQDA